MYPFSSIVFWKYSCLNSTGTISIAVDGELERNFTYATLKQQLVKYLVPDEGPVKRISRRARRAAERLEKEKAADGAENKEKKR